MCRSVTFKALLSLVSDIGSYIALFPKPYLKTWSGESLMISLPNMSFLLWLYIYIYIHVCKIAFKRLFSVWSLCFVVQVVWTNLALENQKNIPWALMVGRWNVLLKDECHFSGSVPFVHFLLIWVFPKIGIPQNGWFTMENPMKMDDLGVPLFSETSIYIYIYNLFIFRHLASSVRRVLREEVMLEAWVSLGLSTR